MAGKGLSSYLVIYTPSGDTFTIRSPRIQTRAEYEAIVRAKDVVFFDKSEIFVGPKDITVLSVNFGLAMVTTFKETPASYGRTGI